MAFKNYANIQLRASAVDAGPTNQDAAVTLPETVNEIWVVVTKTAENNIDNLLTVRLQARVNSVWFDVGWDSIQVTGVLATAADTVTNVTRTPNIADADDTVPTWTIIAHYKSLPSNVVRSIFVSSGTGSGGADTGTMSTFGVESYFRFNQL